MTDIALSQDKLGEGLKLLEQDQLEPALECFLKAIELNPKSAMAYHAKGLVLQDLCRYNESIEAFTKSTELSQQNRQEAASSQNAQVSNSKAAGKPRSCCNMF